MDADAQGTTIRLEATGSASAVESPQAPVERPYPSEAILHEEPQSSQLHLMSWSDIAPKAERNSWEKAVAQP